MGKINKTSASNEQANLFDALPPEARELSLMGLVQFGSALLLKEAVAAEITSYLGRGFYKHLDEGKDFKGHRNGTRTTTVDTPVGQIVYDRQLLVNAPDFQSKFHTPYMRRPEAFAGAIADMHVNGVSTRNVRRALKSVTGERVRLSKSAVSRITKRLRVEFNIWKNRDLSQHKVVYMFLDAIRINMRMGTTSKDAVLIAYGVLEDGSFETLGIGLRNSESDQAWGSFIGDLKRRNLKDPLLIISDGNHGVIEAIEKGFPTGWRQRCVMHKVENVLEQVPREKHDDVRKDLNRIFYGATSVEQARMAVADFKKKYRNVYPSAIECLERDLAQCLTFFMFPSTHWRRIRTSNRLERMNLEIRRRLNSIGRHPSEEGCLALVFQICKRHAEGKNGFKANDLVQALWKRLRNERLAMITQLELELQAA